MLPGEKNISPSWFCVVSLLDLCKKNLIAFVWEGMNKRWLPLQGLELLQFQALSLGAIN